MGLGVARHSKTTIGVNLVKRQVIDDKVTILTDRHPAVATSSAEARGRDTRKTALDCE